VKVLAVLVLGCAIPAAGCGTGSDANELDVHRGLDVSGVTVTDVFAPPDGEGLPVVVMLHGTGGGRDVMEPLARAVAEDGAIVYAPDWPVIDQVAEYPAEDDEPFRLQAEAVVCALRFARRTADEFGGDPDELTLLGHSGGATAGARVALVDEPPWPGIDCDPDVSHAPERFIGTGGDFVGEYQYAFERPDLFRPYDPFSIEVTNSDLEVRLIHGVLDRAVCSRVSVLFDDHLRDLGLDTALVATDTEHSELRDPETRAGRFVADQVSALIHDRPSAFDSDGTPATLTVGDGVCDYSGPLDIDRDGLLRLELRNPTTDPIWLSLVRVQPDSDISIDQIRADRSPAGEGPPEWVDTGDFFLVQPGSTRHFDWAFVDGGARWVIFCMADPNPSDPMKWPSVRFWGGSSMDAAEIISSAG
jgi:pimeloyl-ACP methyl ester carboxylesterase